MTPIGTRLFTWRYGERVGADSLGNVYYRHKDPKLGSRWVIYVGAAEASSVPPEWHAWLHRYADQPPPETAPPKPAWAKDHIPNRTGGAQAYRPPGHDYMGGQRAPATGDYEPWRPE